MIGSIIIEESCVGIPVLDSANFAFFLWKEDESVEDFFKNNGMHESGCCWDRTFIWNKFLDINEDLGTFRLEIYDVICQAKIGYHLICYDVLEEFDDIKHCVCVPYNRLNLLAFYRDYLIPFSDKKFFNG